MEGQTVFDIHVQITALTISLLAGCTRQIVAGRFGRLRVLLAYDEEPFQGPFQWIYLYIHPQSLTTRPRKASIPAG